MSAVGVLESIDKFCRSMHVIVAAYVFGSSATGKDRCGGNLAMVAFRGGESRRPQAPPGKA